MMEYTFRINNLITEKEKSNQFNLRLPFSSVSFNFAIKKGQESRLVFTSEISQNTYIAYPNDYDEAENICMLMDDNHGLVAEISGFVVGEDYIIHKMTVF